MTKRPWTTRAALLALLLSAPRPVSAQPTRRPRPPTFQQLPALTPAPGAAIGTVSPSILSASSPDGRWLVVCEARRDTNADGSIATHLGRHGDTYGDTLEPFFVSSSGPGEAIDDFVGRDPTGRWVAIVRAGRLLLRDTTSGRDEDLSVRGTDASTDDSPFSEHRAAGFDPTGQRMFYVRTESQRTSVVVRELATGRETPIAVSGVLDRANLIGDGSWLAARVVETDTNHDGRVSPMRRETSLGSRRCRGPVMSFFAGAAVGDETFVRVARLGRDTSTHALPGALVTALGARLLVRLPDRSLVAVAADGTSRQWAPASCRGVVLAVAPTFDRALVGCEADEQSRARMEIVGDAGRQSLGVTGMAFAQRERNIPVTAVATFPPVRTRPSNLPDPTVDFATGRVEQGPAHDFALFRSGGQELRMSGYALVARDLATDARRQIVRLREPVYECTTAGAFAVCGNVLVDVAAGRALGRAGSDPYAVASDGRVLIRSRNSLIGGIPPGQFLWVRARAPAPSR